PATAPAGSASTVSATFRTDAGSSGRSLRKSVRTPEERSDDAGMTGSVSEITWRVNVLTVSVIAEGPATNACPDPARTLPKSGFRGLAAVMLQARGGACARYPATTGRGGGGGVEGGKRPGMTDVPRLAGVSHQTVSRVLNDPPSVRPETRER